MRILLLFILQISFVFAASATVWTVDNPTDTSVTTGGTPGDLRYAVTNASYGDYIYFNLPAPYIITLNADLELSNFSLDGTSQLNPITNTPRVTISGNYAVICKFSSGLNINSIRFINNPGRAAITLNSVDGVYIDGCYFGTDSTGLNYSTTTPPDTAIYSLPGSSYSFIGTNSGNVILTPSGVVFDNSGSSSIYNNMIGLNRNGKTPAGTKRCMKGIELISGSNLDIEYNMIGNCQTGAIVADLNSSSNTIQYNSIGNDLSSSAASNAVGVLVNGYSNQINYNTISNSRIISFSSGAGIEISGSTASANNILENSFSCNEGGGIVHTNGSIAYQAATVDSSYVYPDGSVYLSGASGNNGDYIGIYVVDSCGFASQGNYSRSTYANNGTSWYYSGPLYDQHGNPVSVGSKITVMAINNNTGDVSEFINPIPLVAFPCSTIKVYAGKDTTFCSGSLYLLDGKLTNATEATWSSNGQGYVQYSSYSTSGTPSYYDVYYDVTAGVSSFEIYLTSTQGGCPAVIDTMTVFLPVPHAYLFGNISNVSACPNTTTGIALDLKITNPSSSGGTWTTNYGTGTFLPNVNSENATYIPSAGDLGLGYPVDLNFTPIQDAGGCATIGSSVNMDFYNTDPVSNGTTVKSYCANSPAIYLPNNAGTSTTEVWTYKGGAAIKDSIDSGNLMFVPTAAEVNSGSVVLIDKISIPGCVSTYDTLSIRYVKVPVVFAGDSSAICGNATSFKLSQASVLNLDSGSVQWSGYIPGVFNPNLLTKSANKSAASQIPVIIKDGGNFLSISGSFSNDTIEKPVYYPSVEDRKYPGVRLVISVRTAGNECIIDSEIPISFSPVPDTVYAGSDTTLCQGENISIQNAYVSGGYAHKWTSGGTGKFLPNNTSLNATYVPSSADLKKIAFNLTLTGGTQICPVKDDFLLILVPKPDVGVGSSQIICPETSASLSAAKGADQIGLWTRMPGATGVFEDSTNNNVVVTNITASTNSYKWTITDTATHCTNSAIYSVNYCSAPPLKVFNALSPNRDGLGECLRIENIDFYKDNQVSIFNRWGDMLFKVSNYKNLELDDNGMEKDGTGNAFTGQSNIGTVQELPNGSYFYVIDKGTTGEKSEKGFLVIQK